MTTSQDLQLRTERGVGQTVVYAAGEVDYGSASRLRSALIDLLREANSETVVVELSDVTFVDSTALSVLVQAKQRFESVGSRMTVTGAQPKVMRVLQLSGLEDYLAGD